MFGNYDATCFLKNRFVGPAGIQRRQIIGNTIVLSKQYDL